MRTAFIEARVAKGAKFLDGKMLGWHRHVDLGTLDLSTGRQCILGQLYADVATPFFGGWSFGRLHLGLEGRDVDRMGFYISRLDKMRGATWERLTMAWRQEIVTRRIRDDERNFPERIPARDKRQEYYNASAGDGS